MTPQIFIDYLTDIANGKYVLCPSCWCICPQSSTVCPHCGEPIDAESAETAGVYLILTERSSLDFYPDSDGNLLRARLVVNPSNLDPSIDHTYCIDYHADKNCVTVSCDGFPPATGTDIELTEALWSELNGLYRMALDDMSNGIPTGTDTVHIKPDGESLGLMPKVAP